ncbi:MAG: hypothetical protein LKJ05_04225 [Bifidobacteriaceae bacterium]|jgi:hypothetical protein|nr:hypothetical protein [Bifidobacteriaceae bacterium]
MSSAIRETRHGKWLFLLLMAVVAACFIPLASNFASNRAFAAGTVDPSILSVTTSTPTVTVESANAAEASETLDVTYDASVGDVLTATIPSTFKGTVTYDPDINGSKVTKSGNVISVTFAKAGKISDFQITLKPDRTAMNNDESPVSKVGNADYMQVGNYTVDLAATKAGKQYSATATFRMQPLVSAIPTWTKMPLDGRTFTRNVTYSFDDTSLGIFYVTNRGPETDYGLALSYRAYIDIPGGFSLDTSKSSKGFSQPNGVGGPVVWTNPGGLLPNAGVNFVGKFTSPAGKYSTSSDSVEQFSGYYGYGSKATVLNLTKPVYSVNIVDYQDPKFNAVAKESVLIGSPANKASNNAETQFTQEYTSGVSEEDQKSVATTGTPTIDGSVIIGGTVNVRTQVGQTITFIGAKKDGTSVNQSVTLTKANAVGNQLSDGSYNFMVPLPSATMANPLTSITVKASSVLAGNTSLRVLYQYQALTTLANGTALTDGKQVAASDIRFTGTGVTSGHTWTSPFLGGGVVYRDSLTSTGDAVCASVKSESQKSCVYRFGDSGTLSMGGLSVEDSNYTERNFDDTLLNQPIAYYMIPKYAEFTGITKGSGSQSAYGTYGTIENVLQSQNKLQDPVVTTSTLPNGQTLVKLDWTGKGFVPISYLSTTKVNFKYPTHMVDGKSLVATWLNISKNTTMKNLRIANALQTTDMQTALQPETAAIMDTDTKANPMGTMYAEVSGPKLLSGGIDIIDNTGVKSQAAENNIKNGTKHSIDIEVFSNESVATPKIAGLLNLPSDSDGLGLNLTQAGTIEDADGNKIADTGATTDKAYLLYSTKVQPVTSTAQAIDTTGYVRASAVTDWSSIRSVILYVPSLESQDWYTANLPLDAPKAADQIDNKVSIPLHVFSAEKQYEANDPVTDVFTSDVPAWLKTTPRGGRAYEDGDIDPSKLVDLTKIPSSYDRSDTDLVWEMSDYAPGNGYEHNTAAKAQKLGVLTLKAGEDTPTWTWDASCDTACRIMEGVEVYKVRVAAGVAPSTHDATKTDVTDVVWAPGATEASPVEVPVEVYTPLLITRDQYLLLGDEAKFSDSADATIKWTTEDSCTADGTTVTSTETINPANCDATDGNDITEKPTVDTHFWFLAGSDPKDDSAGTNNTSEPYGTTATYHPTEVSNFAVGVTLKYSSGADAKTYDYAQGKGHENDGSQYANVTSQLTKTDEGNYVVAHSASSVGTAAFSTQRHRKTLAVAQQADMIYGEVSRPDAVEDLPHNSEIPVTIYVHGTTVAHLPLTGGLATERVILLTVLAAVVFAGVLAAGSWIGKKRHAA